MEWQVIRAWHIPIQFQHLHFYFTQYPQASIPYPFRRYYHNGVMVYLIDRCNYSVQEVIVEENGHFESLRIRCCY